MRILTGMVVMGGALCVTPVATAQRPGGGPGADLSKSADAADLTSRMMAFDKNNDGKLTRSEVTDRRLLRLFDRADADKDGTVTRAELTALGEKEHAEVRGGPGFGPPGGPGFGPPPGGGPGGPPPRPGQVLSPMLQQRLKLSPRQRTQLDELQKEVDARLDTILSTDQKAQLRAMRQRGPGGFGFPGGGLPPGGPPPGGGPRPGDEPPPGGEPPPA